MAGSVGVDVGLEPARVGGTVLQALIDVNAGGSAGGLEGEAVVDQPRSRIGERVALAGTARPISAVTVTWPNSS